MLRCRETFGCRLWLPVLLSVLLKCTLVVTPLDYQDSSTLIATPTDCPDSSPPRNAAIELLFYRQHKSCTGERSSGPHCWPLHQDAFDFIGVCVSVTLTLSFCKFTESSNLSPKLICLAQLRMVPGGMGREFPPGMGEGIFDIVSRQSDAFLISANPLIINVREAIFEKMFWDVGTASTAFCNSRSDSNWTPASSFFSFWETLKSWLGPIHESKVPGLTEKCFPWPCEDLLVLSSEAAHYQDPFLHFSGLFLRKWPMNLSRGVQWRWPSAVEFRGTRPW